MIIVSPSITFYQLLFEFTYLILSPVEVENGKFVFRQSRQLERECGIVYDDFLLLRGRRDKSISDFLGPCLPLSLPFERDLPHVSV